MNKLSISSILITFLFTIFLNTNSYSQAPTIAAGDLYLVNLSSVPTSSCVFTNAVCWKQVGLSGIPSPGTDPNASPSATTTCFLDIDNLAGKPIQINSGSICKNLIITDGVATTIVGSVLQMNAALEIRGGASGTSSTTLCVAPTATINGSGYMQLTSNMGGVISSTSSGSLINIPYLQINSTNYTNDFKITDSLKCNVLHVANGFFNSNSKRIINTGTFYFGNTSSLISSTNARMLLDNSIIDLYGAMWWNFYNAISPSSLFNYSGINTIINIQNSSVNNDGHLIGGKLNNNTIYSIQIINNYRDKPFTLTTSCAGGEQIPIGTINCTNSFQNFNYTGVGLKLGTLQVDKGLVSFTGLANAFTPTTRFEISNLLLGNACSNNSLLIDGLGNANLWLVNPINVSNVGVKNIIANNNVLNCSNSTNLGGNSASVTFSGTPITNDYYWKGSLGNSNWNDPINWRTDAALTVTTTCIPGLNSNVYFTDLATTKTVTTDGVALCKDMLWNNTTSVITFTAKSNSYFSGTYYEGYFGNKVYVNGSLKFPTTYTNIVNNNESSFTFCGKGTHSITANRTTFKHSIILDSDGGFYTLMDTLKTKTSLSYLLGFLNITKGNFNSNGKVIDVNSLYSYGTNVNLNNSNIFINHYSAGVGWAVYLNSTTSYTANNNTNWFMNCNGGIYSDFGSLIYNKFLGNIISNQSSDASFVNVRNLSGNPSFPIVLGKIIRNKGDIQFAPYNCTYSAPGSLYKMDSLCFRTSGNVIISSEGPSYPSYSLTINLGINTPNLCSNNYKITGVSGSSVTTPTLIFSSTQNVHNSVIENIFAQNSSTSFANNSVLFGTSAGWTVSSPLSQTFYWTGEATTANWNDWQNWKLTSPPLIGASDDLPTGNPGHCLPSFNDNVIFHANSFPKVDSVNIKTNISFNDMTWLNSGTGAVTGLNKKFVCNGSNISVYGSLFFCNKLDNSAFNSKINLLANDAGNVISSRGSVFLNGSSVNYFSFNGNGQWQITDSLIAPNFRIYHSKGNLNMASSLTNTIHVNCYTFNSTSAFTRTLNISGTIIDAHSWGYGAANFGIITTNLTYIDNYKTFVRLYNGYSSSLPMTVEITGSTSLNFKGTIRYFKTAYLGFLLQNTTVRSKFHNIIVDDINLFVGQASMDRFPGYGANDTEIDSLIFSPNGGKDLILANGKTLSINQNFEVSGTYCNKNYIHSFSPGIQTNICGTSSLALQSKYIDLQDINSASCLGFSSTYTAVVNSTDGGNNTGWTFGPTYSPLPGFGPNPTLLCNQFPTTITTTGFYTTPSTTFSWTSGTGTLTPTQIANDSLPITLAGTYSVMVTYGTSCFITGTTTYSVNNNLTYTFTPSNVKCNLGSSGSATLNVSNTSSLTNYSWNLTSAGLGTLTTVTNTFVTGLTAGNYTVNIKDPNCARTQTFTITQPTAFTVTPSTNSVSCFGAATGSGTVAVSGATPAYTYSWAPAIASTTNSASGLSSGSIYTVTVKDLNNCITTKTLSVIQPTSAVNSVAVGISSVTCFGASTGSAQVNASGGTPGYTYSWSPSVSSTTNTASALSAGIFTATVKDANGCISTKTISITQPTSAVSVAATTQTNVLCFGGNSGTASLIAAGGTPGYTYSWTPSVLSTTNTASGLGIGNYTATIKDAKGCIRTQTFSITQPPILNATVTNTSTSNCGLANGSATITTTGGTPSYTYSWSPPAPFPTYTSTSAITNSLPAGNNNLTVFDGNGCTYTLTASITNPTAPSVTVSTNSVLCNGQASGSASVIASGGTPAYSYTWSNSSNSTSISSLTAGNYSIVVMDASLCQSTQTFVINEPTVLATAISNIINVNCFGGNNGSASVTTTGGTPIYSYSWLPGGGSTSTGTNLAQGIYTVTITDNNNCTKTNTVEILGISQDMNISITDTVKPDCGNYTNGSLTVGVTGGTPTYTYLWNNGSTTPSNTNITNSTYTVTVTDANNCSKQLEITLDCFTSFFIPEIFSPNNDGKNDVFEIKGIYQFPNNKLTIFNRWGNVVYQKEKYNNEWDGKPNVNTGTGSDLLPQGTYYVLFDFGDDGKNETYKGYVQLEY